MYFTIIIEVLLIYLLAAIFIVSLKSLITYPEVRLFSILELFSMDNIWTIILMTLIVRLFSFLNYHG